MKLLSTSYMKAAFPNLWKKFWALKNNEFSERCFMSISHEFRFIAQQVSAAEKEQKLTKFQASLLRNYALKCAKISC